MPPPLSNIERLIKLMDKDEGKFAVEGHQVMVGRLAMRLKNGMPWHPHDGAYITVLLPEVTISTHTEIDQAEEEIILPLQQIYTGRKPVISASLADTPCTTFGAPHLLDPLNLILGTSYTMDTPLLPSLLEDCITKEYDFGTAYGCLHAVWHTLDWNTVWDKLCGCEAEDQTVRRKAVHGNGSVDSDMYPWHVWDLYSNRVVPIWTTGKIEPHPISHAWVDENDRMDVWTPINGREWPVPILKNANLNLIRIEMLNNGLEYVWLDVLCLRQKGGLREDLCAEEWKLDVPTIGWVYERTKMHCYLKDYFDSDCCWFNHAWTLQEIRCNGYAICRVTPNGPLNAKPDKDSNYDTQVLTTFHQKLQSLKRLTIQKFDVLEEMRRRVLMNPVDKIAGMAMLLRSPRIPAYYESQSLEDAWTAFMNTASRYIQVDLFFKYPEPGNASAKW
ncbi:hypothetical protein ARMGADRAFT_1137901 [Armillaria gallica]|uniref:Heterokaryon incompatibility domain-containing protein n=1 Tax=Armillaria gallica TaxID=47427 RepID=A0A2H3CM20_ARMGA|nr:hypothetical protein ARMGADRAFT_1137901 [Armillaria gallica]